jgi:hypothetical protein
MLLPTDKIVGHQRVDPYQFRQWVERRGAVGPYREWIDGVAEACEIAHIDRAIILFQGEFETGGFKSEHWIRGNSGGLGITDGDDVTPFDISDLPNYGRIAAQIHVASMYAMLGRTSFPRILQPARRKYAPAWIERVMDLVENEPARPAVVRLDDLNVRYRGRDGRMRATWAWDAEYDTNMVARALAAPVQVPSQRYLGKSTPFEQPKRFQVKYHSSLWEGPCVTDNRRLATLAPGQFLTFQGETLGHAPQGDPVWYYTGGPLFGYVHRSAVMPA